ncbi:MULTISPECIES: restriction endonuclease subunit S [Photobacterium]|uniref:Type I restriction modification DNA specificity domain-containing protein n=1 Tax=Photobacterium carnosum TaxID=2023717 RepID=A0A2N4UMP1_9GAMM|nr:MULTISPECIES: restriction endonuclease subunit S [Photobacterium]MCD9513011.1 restriction endonuclease subunit S [Photobacterium phosphoreum]PLC56276.1 hypothetical protein CIK00_19415 [Photobacterium carnosum]
MNESCHKSISLGDIFKVSSGGTPSRKKSEYFNGDIPWVKTGDLKGVYANQPTEFITQLGLDNSSAKLFPPSTVLLAMYGATIGACSILSFEAATNQACAAILPNENYNEKYLYYYFCYIKPSLVRLGVGGAQPNISAGLIKKLKIPNLVLEEQKKIAEILDAADSLRQKDKQLVEHYDRLSQSLFLDMFGVPNNNIYDFEIGTIRDLVNTVNYGTSAKAQMEGEYTYLRMNNITYQGYMNFESLKFIDLSEKDQDKYLVKKGDILFNRTNSKELVGKTGLFDKDISMAIAGYLIRVRANEKANPYYLWRFMNSNYCKKVLAHMCKSIVGMANINAQELQNIKVLIPPIELQNQFEKTIKEIENQKTLAQQALLKSEDLFNSLLQKAFKGELTNR